MKDEHVDIESRRSFAVLSGKSEAPFPVLPDFVIGHLSLL